MNYSPLLCVRSSFITETNAFSFLRDTEEGGTWKQWRRPCAYNNGCFATHHFMTKRKNRWMKHTRYHIFSEGDWWHQKGAFWLSFQCKCYVWWAFSKTEMIAVKYMQKNPGGKLSRDGNCDMWKNGLHRKVLSGDSVGDRGVTRRVNWLVDCLLHRKAGKLGATMCQWQETSYRARCPLLWDRLQFRTYIKEPCLAAQCTFSYNSPLFTRCQTFHFCQT